MWRNLRILILLLILLFVALNTYFDRLYSTDWDYTLRITVYPINGDGSEQSEQFIRALTQDDFASLETFFIAEAREYGVKLEQPVRFKLAPQLRELPEEPERGAGILSTMMWSLRTRYWAWRVPDPPGAAPDIKLFVLYHDPQRSPALPHSLGLQKGLFGIVHVFADREMFGSNDTVIGHELLHTLGATDKYDPATTQPLFPIGYAEPDREPLYPQSAAEIMGGRIPLAPDRSEIPVSLRQVIVGSATALEIGWTQP